MHYLALGLLARLSAFGVTGDALASLASYAKNGKQRVCVSNSFSIWESFHRVGHWAPCFVHLFFSAKPSIYRTLCHALLNAISSLTIPPSCQLRNVRTMLSSHLNLLLTWLVSGCNNGFFLRTLRILRSGCYDRTVYLFVSLLSCGEWTSGDIRQSSSSSSTWDGMFMWMPLSWLS